MKNLSIECLCILDFALGRKFLAVIYGNATAIFSNKSIVCRVWGECSEHQRDGWISRRKSCCKREFKDRTSVLLYARGRKYFNTDACNIKGAKAVRTAIIRVLDERANGRVRGRSHARKPISRASLSCAYVAHTCISKIYVAYLRVYTKGADVYGRTGNHLLEHWFPRAFSDALFWYSALTIHLQRTPLDAALVLRGTHSRDSQMHSREIRWRMHVKIRPSTKLLDENRTALFLFFLDS